MKDLVIDFYAISKELAEMDANYYFLSETEQKNLIEKLILKHSNIKKYNLAKAKGKVQYMNLDFRVWSVSNKKMYYLNNNDGIELSLEIDPGNQWSLSKAIAIEDIDEDGKKEIFNQFYGECFSDNPLYSGVLMHGLGIKDHIGKQVYEDDILYDIDLDYGIVKYDDKAARFYVDFGEFGRVEAIHCIINDNKVVGNIHENPEMIK